MDPDHLPLLLELEDDLGELAVDLLVLLPELLPPQVVFEVIKALEVVEEGAEDGLVELEELLQGLLREEYWVATVLPEDFCDFSRLAIVFRDDTRPPETYDLDHLFLFTHFKQCRVEH